MIEIENLAKYYGPTRSLDGLSFQVPEGEVLGLLGPNGAGKTTTMRILTGLTRPTRGRARVGGFDTVAQHGEVRRLLGYLPEDAPMYEEMRVEQYLRFMANMKDIPARQVRSEVDRVVDETDLQGWRKRLVSNLSKGTRQRVGLAQAILGNPKVVILDEPTVGLDPSQISEVRQLIARMKERRTVVLSTHILPEVSMTCSRVVIIKQGKLVAEGTLDEIGQRLGGRRIEFVARATQEAIRSAVAPVLEAGSEWIEQRDLEGGLVRSVLGPAGDSAPSPAIARALVEAGIDLMELREVRPTLEDLFLRATATPAAPENAAA